MPDREEAAIAAARNLFYLEEMLPPDEFDTWLALTRRSIYRMSADDGDRKDKWSIVRRETVEALAHKESASNLPARGRLFSHIDVHITYGCATARLSENAHRAVKRMIHSVIQRLEVEYKGHRVDVREVRPWG